MIWTTTPWTMPGNRAVAAGADFDYAVIQVDAVADGSLARPAEKLVVAEALLPPFLKDAGITAHTRPGHAQGRRNRRHRHGPPAARPRL